MFKSIQTQVIAVALLSVGPIACGGKLMLPSDKVDAPAPETEAQQSSSGDTSSSAVGSTEVAKASTLESDAQIAAQLKANEEQVALRKDIVAFASNETSAPEAQYVGLGMNREQAEEFANTSDFSRESFDLFVSHYRKAYDVYTGAKLEFDVAFAWIIADDLAKGTIGKGDGEKAAAAQVWQSKLENEIKDRTEMEAASLRSLFKDINEAIIFSQVKVGGEVGADTDSGAEGQK